MDQYCWQFLLVEFRTLGSWSLKWPGLKDKRCLCGTLCPVKGSFGSKRISLKLVEYVCLILFFQSRKGMPLCLGQQSINLEFC
jgi:hypothetical protein